MTVRLRSLVRTAVAASCLSLATPAAAQIDMTGTWSVTLSLGPPSGQRPPPFEESFSQTGTALSSPSFGSGTIDPSTGVFHLEESVTCTQPIEPFEVHGTASLEGTVAPHGLAFSGSRSTILPRGLEPLCVPVILFATGERTGGTTTTTTTSSTTTSTTLAPAQAILGNSLTVRDPKPGVDPSKRTIVGSAKEKNSPNLLVGDPTRAGIAGGAILQVLANGATPSAQTFVLAQGTSSSGKPFWSGSASTGFTYKDSRGEQGPVKTVSIERSGGGSFSIQAVVSGKNGPVTVVPPNPGTDGCMVLDLGIDPAQPGDRYSVRFGPESTVKNVADRLFKVTKPTVEGDCPTTYGSPSRAFLMRSADLLD
jgi:hypothetical protein